MGHIGDLFKRVDELQKEIEGIKKENQDLKDLIKDKTGVDVGATSNNTDDKTDNVDGVPVPKPVTANKPNCPINLNYNQGLIAGRIINNLQRKALSITQLLHWIEDKLIKDPKVVLDIRRQRKH
jgi:hypothetical protein